MKILALAVTALITLSSQALSQVPDSLNRITSESATALPVDSLRAILDLFTGVYDTGNPLGPVIRGGRPDETATYFDGINIRNFSSGRWAMLRILPDQIADITVLRDAYRPRYGHAQSGVIMITPRTPSDEWRGALRVQTDELGVGSNFGQNRLSAFVSGPVFGPAMRISISGGATGMADAEPSFSPEDLGTISGFGGATTLLGQSKYYRPTAATDTVNVGETPVVLRRYTEIEAGDRKPYNNADEYAFDIVASGELGAFRYRAGYAASRFQRRTFTPMLAFRPQTMPASREKSSLMRIELARDFGTQLTARLNMGLAEDHMVGGFLGETLEDTASVFTDSKYPLFGDAFGFTFADYKFPLEEKFTAEMWLERFATSRTNPFNFLYPAAVLIDPRTGLPYTKTEASSEFEVEPTVDNPYALLFSGTGLIGYTEQRERTWTFHPSVEWRAGTGRLFSAGIEVVNKAAENISGIDQLYAELGENRLDVYSVEPRFVAGWVNASIESRAMKAEAGVRVDRFASDGEYPDTPGFVAGSAAGLPGTFTAEPTLAVSPRVKIMMKIGREAELRVSAASFAQAPAFADLYRNVHNEVRRSSGGLSYGQPVGMGRTTAVDAAITYSITPRLVVDVGAYQRSKRNDDIYEFEDIAYDFGDFEMQSIAYLLSANGAGSARGIDAQIAYRRNAASAVIGYSNVSIRDQIRAPVLADPVTGIPLTSGIATRPPAYALTHTLNASLLWAAPAGSGVWLNGTEAAVIARASSGAPFTRSKTPEARARLANGAPIEMLNSSRMDATYHIDLRLGRAFSWNGWKARAFVDGRNILDRKNARDLFTYTGSPTDPGNLGLIFVDPNTDVILANIADPVRRALLTRREQAYGDGDGVLTLQENTNIVLSAALLREYGGATPQAMFEPPRQIRIGVEWELGRR